MISSVLSKVRPIYYSQLSCTDGGTDAFSAQLRRVSLVTMPDEELMEKRSNDLGLDSLVSVGIREWFLKNFQVSIAVLKIIGNNTMASLAEDVAALGKKLPEFVFISLETHACHIWKLSYYLCKALGGCSISAKLWTGCIPIPPFSEGSLSLVL